MIIKNADKNDIEKIANLYISNWKKTYNGLLSEDYLNNMTLEYCLHKWTKYLNNPSNKIFVAYKDESFLGFTACKKDDEEDNCLYLDSLHVNKASRGKGVGTKLINKVCKYAIDRGYDRMSICIVKGNDNARKLYKKLGAVHYKDFIDDFGGTKSNSEKLMWNNLNCFK